MIRFAIKCGIVGGTVYASNDLGVWGSQKDSEKIYNNMIEAARPHIQDLKKNMPFEMPALPDTGEIRFLAKHYYNCGVKSTFRFIHMIPCYLGQMAKSTKDAINKALDAPPVVK